MRHLKISLAAIAVFFFMLTGCKKDIQNDALGSKNELQGNSLKEPLGKLSAGDLKAKLTRLLSSLPPGYAKNLKVNSAFPSATHPEYRDMVLRALKVIEPTPCNDNTLINQWLNQQLADWNDEVFGYVFDFAMLDLPLYDAYVFENSSANQYFGVNGEYTHVLVKTFKDLQRFWNIQSSNIVLVAMHGSMLRDRDKIIRTYEAAYGVDPATAAILADIVTTLIEVFPQYRNGDHPIFTFNAFAVPGFDYQPFAVIKDKIIMGDGIMEAYTAIGYDDVAPQAILAHEFGHHIQFQLGLFEDVSSPEATRRTELMADAYSAYYLSHARGAAMQWKRVKQFLQVFFNIGDCAFTSNGHHGTPTQRMASAEWAYNLANNARPQGHILTAQEFTALFEAQLPELLTH